MIPPSGWSNVGVGRGVVVAYGVLVAVDVGASVGVGEPAGASVGVAAVLMTPGSLENDGRSWIADTARNTTPITIRICIPNGKFWRKRLSEKRLIVICLTFSV